MKPAKFEIVRPASLAEACQVLAQSDGAAKPIAGGQSLGPMLNLRLTQPGILVDITAIPELVRIEESDGVVTFGACVSTASIEDGLFPTGGLAMLPDVARRIAYRAVRNRGTIGGSLCHADPAADWMAALLALEGECLITGVTGSRAVPLGEFMQSAFEVRLDKGELLDAIRIPRTAAGAKWAYEKISRKTGEFALAIGAVLSDPERGVCRAVAGATDGRPIVIEDARTLGASSKGTAAAFDQTAAARLLTEGGLREESARQFHVAALGRAYLRALGQ